uniref:Uncharacterized protein n=1 Tax=Solanum lycopersicum TaxID=4081 RepID=A0A3Q7EQR1_SOLLC
MPLAAIDLTQATISVSRGGFLIVLFGLLVAIQVVVEFLEMEPPLRLTFLQEENLLLFPRLIHVLGKLSFPQTPPALKHHQFVWLLQIVVKLPMESFDRILCTAGLLFGKLTEDDPAETKLGVLFISSSRQAEDPSCPETSTPTSSLWLSRAKRPGFISADAPFREIRRFGFSTGTFIEQQALSSAIGDRDVQRSVVVVGDTSSIPPRPISLGGTIPDRIFVCFSQQKMHHFMEIWVEIWVRVEVHTGGSVTDKWINFLLDILLLS